MPELPEVETVRLQLQRLIPGKTVQRVTITVPMSFIGNGDFLIGKKILSVSRIAKMLVIDFEKEISLGIHLKMTGQLLFRGKQEKHTRVILHFNDGDELYFNDQRKFGWMRIFKNATMENVPMQQLKDIPFIEDFTKNVGPDALNELTFDHLISITKRSKRPIKLILMDQEKIGGVGNIYANEALFYAGIAPTTPSFRLSKKKLSKLLNKLRFVLMNGLKWGGASRTNFLDVYGKKGLVQDHFSVYDREKVECPNTCGNVISRIVLGGRGTFFCPNCQS